MKPLYVTLVGSKLYGTYTSESDTDFKGIAFPEVDELIGLKNFEQKEFEDTEHEDGPDKMEGSIFAVRKYINLCMKGNPTVIELAFADPKFHAFTTPLGLEIMEYVREHMLTKHLFKPYSAYHKAQMRKLQSKKREGKRKEIVETHGYDPKFSMHAYRLAKQCVIVFREGVLRPTLDPEDLELAKKIRAGKENFTMEEVLEILEEVDKEMYDAYKESTLPEAPKFHEVNDFMVDIHRKYIKGHYNMQLENKFSLMNVRKVASWIG
jgi:predicted nucleotidyltransferase